MKIKIIKSSTLVQHLDGSWAERIEHDVEPLNTALEDNAIKNAIKHFYQYRDIEPLVIEFKEKNNAVFRNSEAMKLIETASMGQLLIGKGRTKTLEVLRRDYYICRSIYHLKQAGLPIKGDANRGKLSACELTGEKFNISASAAYTIWREHIGSGKAVNSFEITPWKLMRYNPSPEEIADYFYYNAFAGNYEAYDQRYRSNELSDEYCEICQHQNECAMGNECVLTDEELELSLKG